MTQQEELNLIKSRAQIYELLALIYGKEITAEAIDVINTPEVADAFKEAGVDISSTLNAKNRDELVLELSVEYASLFLGPARHIPPYESVHRPDTEGGGLLWGKVTAEIKRLVKSLNLCYNKEYKDLPDHISIEFELMKRLIDYEAGASKRADNTSARRALELENKLMEEHISQWVPQFCEKVIAQTTSDFYRAIASFTKGFILTEQKNIRECIAMK